MTRKTDNEMVREFSERFGIPIPPVPTQLNGEAFQYRLNFMHEELEEFAEAWGSNSIVDQADALVDLVYVALGTAAMMGLPWDQIFEAVHKANMQKVRALPDDMESRHALDVRKPPGWTGPEVEIGAVLASHGWAQR